jgi:predicted DNA-binding helix-hairpin-helix protein
MDSLDKLRILGGGMELEPGESEREIPRAACSAGIPVFHAIMPHGRSLPVLKTMLTSVCERNCNYCSFRSERDVKRVSFTPDEMAATHLRLWRSGLVQGLFLSSSIAGGSVRTQDRLIDTADILRNKLNYTGYLHLKVMPGADQGQVLRSMQLADRVSINLEGPSPQRLAALAPMKQFDNELLKTLQWMNEIRVNQSPAQAWKRRWPSLITQLVVGAVGENDLELLSTAEYLHDRLKLARIYYSIFSPIPGTPFENLPAGDPCRQHRLYQADFLLRDYGFTLEDMPFKPDGSLPLDSDPKLAWAREHLADRPIDVNHGTP